KEINVSNNHLAALKINESTNLEYLHVGNNQLRELDLERNTNLKSLICFENLTQLKLLDCDEILQPIANLKEIYEAKLKEIQTEKDKVLRNLQNEQASHRETLAKLI
ncbi:5622_t:CDS:2, partial [Gigaspora margarita]